MATETDKHLERARRSLEKNKLREAATEYQAVLEAAPSNQEALQALADLYTRLNDPETAAHYYGAQFDRLLEVGDAAKASALFQRFLRPFPQPPDRLMRYGMLLQKQNRAPEAIEQFGAAAALYQQQQREIEALACYESIALLDPENPSRHLALGELAERLGHSDLASRSYVKSGQLTLAKGLLDEALEYFERGHSLSPADREGSVLFAEAKLRKGDAQGAVALLDPLSATEKDLPFLGLYGEALVHANRLDDAKDVFESYCRQKPEGFGKLFEVAGAYVRRDEDAKAAALLIHVKDAMRAARKEPELVSQMDRLAAAHPGSLALAEVVARLYEEMNRETKYFEALMRLFDLYLDAGQTREACDSLDKLVDIDPYDYRNHERISRLEGKADPLFLQNILARAAKAATASMRTEGFSGAGSQSALGQTSDESRSQQALEDLIVQVEIFLQYSLQSKAVERLERIAEMFPGEEERNERLRALYERSNWWPRGASAKSTPKPGTLSPSTVPPMAPSLTVPEPAVSPAASAADTHRDLAAIAEINRMMYRQASLKEVLSTTAGGIAKHLGVTRCIVTMGAAGDEAQVNAEFCAVGEVPATPEQMASLAAVLAKTTPDALGGIELQSSASSVLKELGIESALGAILTEKETQGQGGALLVGDSSRRKWKPNESFFLQAVGDQLVLSVNHTRLRSLVRSLAVADEKTGLLNRGAYIDCLLVESSRARVQNTPLSLVILTIDRGGEILRLHGDATVDDYVEQLAHALSAAVRQTDIAVKYTTWSLAFILPGTSLENARALAEKLRQVAATVRPSWGGQDLTISAIVAQATSRPADETEDRVTEWINRAEAGLDETRQRGGNTLVALATP